MDEFAHIPLRRVGPVRISGPELDGEVMIPLATLESPLWPSVARGARVTARAGGIRAIVRDDRMARSVLLEASDALEAVRAAAALEARRGELAELVASTSRFAKFLDLHTQVAGCLLFLRLEISTGDAAGHNMVTKAAQGMIEWAVRACPALRAVSVSGNYCTDKKVSAVNGILGRGKCVLADVLIPGALCRTQLKTTAARIAELNVKKNLVGTMLAGGVRTANAHFANMLLAFYLATGQDAANIVEGSQGLTYAEARGEDLYFSVTLPNVIVGAVGAGKDREWARANLEALGCLEPRAPGANARRLAAIAAAAVLCGELSLMAALTVPGELMRAHERLERKK